MDRRQPALFNAVNAEFTLVRQARERELEESSYDRRTGARVERK